MYKNENGFPVNCVPCQNCQMNDGCNMPSDDTNPPNTPPGDVGGVGGNHNCGGTGNCLDNMPLAYVYGPDQRFRMLYSANDALRHGTLFEELYKPMEVYGRE